VKHFISIQPSTRLRLQGFHGENVSKKVTITSHEEKPFKITDISSTIDSSIEYKLETIEKEKAYSLEIKTRSGIKESFRGKVVLKTSSQKKPKIQLQVMGKVKKELKVVPQYLFFGVIDTNKKAIDPQSLTRTVTVNRQRDGELTIGKIKTHSAWISAEVETNKKDKEHTIVIKLDKEKLQKGKFRERVTINTMFSGRSEAATIIVEGKVI
jgi:hypothetical protein